MQHLTEQELVLHHYHDDESPAAVAEHLLACDGCRAEFNSIRSVLALVDEMPVPERGNEYGAQVWSRLRWKLGNERSRRRSWQTAFAAAAVLAIVFFAGVLWHARVASVARPVGQQAAAPAGTQPTAAATQSDRVLLVVVTDHLDTSERMLRDVANADAKDGLDLGDEQKRAVELVASNRLYRDAALQHGDTRLAAVLNDLEPILLEIAHSDGKLSPAEAGNLQKRIDSKGLLFKVRVMTAQKGTNSV
ncbi:MAG TPA: hypothetical protein VL284_17780 [Thermoanaerobaculia bacterium]|nr:hypothetical protein [Thermoanaerobaculia bacterium]